MRPRRALAVLLPVVAALVLAACGYTTRALVPDQYRTIAVPIFENTTRRHDLEWEVTRAVVEELHAEGVDHDVLTRGEECHGDGGDRMHHDREAAR